MAVVMAFALLAVAVTAAVDYLFQLIPDLLEERGLPEGRRLTPENIQAAVELIERAANLWD